MQQIYRRTTMPKCDFNEVALRCLCSSALVLKPWASVPGLFAPSRLPSAPNFFKTKHNLSFNSEVVITLKPFFVFVLIINDVKCKFF